MEDKKQKPKKKLQLPSLVETPIEDFHFKLIEEYMSEILEQYSCIEESPNDEIYKRGYEDSCNFIFRIMQNDIKKLMNSKKGAISFVRMLQDMDNL